MLANNNLLDHILTASIEMALNLKIITVHYKSIQCIRPQKNEWNIEVLYYSYLKVERVIDHTIN